MRTLTILTAALLLPALPALAQDKSAPATFAFSKDQLAKIQQINARYDAQIKAAFAGDDTTVSAMQAELKQIEAQKDAGKRTSAIAAYQAKYAKTYKAALAKGKVNLNAWAGDLRAVTPGLIYTVKDGTHILATASSTTSSDPMPTLPAKAVKTLRGADFEFVKEVGCGPISGSDVTRSGLNMTNDTWAAEAGGCRNVGTLTHILNVSSDQKALVDLKADMNSDVWAVGVVAIATSSGATSLVIRKDDGSYCQDKRFFCFAGVPILWAASESCGGDGITLSKNLNSPGEYQVIAETYTNTIAGGVVAVTTSASTLRDFSAKITLEPR